MFAIIEPICATIAKCECVSDIKSKPSCTSLSFDSFDISALCDDAFAGLHGLSALTLPQHITRIPNCCFRDCYSLLSIELPANILSIGDCAFENCSSLQHVTICAQSEIALGKDVFKNCTALSTVTLAKSNCRTLEKYYEI